MGVDLVAPGARDLAQGIGIYSADKDDPHGYIHMWGTSQATPHVTGAIALMQEAAMVNFGHKLDYYDVYDILIDAADPVGQTVPNNDYGWGRLDCKAVVDSVLTFRLKSSSPYALAFNNQHKLVYDPINDRFHLVYQSGQTFEGRGRYIRYTSSTDGENWTVDQKLGDGDAPSIAVDDAGNVHCIYRDGNAIKYQRIINGIPGPAQTLFIDLFALEIGVPAFTIYGNNGYVAFELYNQWMQSHLYIGSFDITSANPVLQYGSLESTSEYRFGAPALAINPDYGLVVVYTRQVNGVPEVYYRASANNWQLVLVSSDDGVKSTSPVVVSGNGLWFLWEDGGVEDIYYRWRTEQWQNPPSPVYVSSEASSILPRVVVNSFEPEKLYIAWAEQTGSTYNIYASAYYGEWQSPTVISSSPVWSIDPDIAYVPGGMIEGRLLVVYAEGNERWLERGGYLPLYRVCTYQSVLPLASGGGPQDVGAVPMSQQKPMLDIYPNPGDVFTVKYAISCETPVNLSLYDITGRLVRVLVNEIQKPCSYQRMLDLSNLAQGVYFVRLETDNCSETKKVVLLR